MDYLSHQNEATVGDSNLELVRGARVRRNVCLDRARASRHRAAPHGRRKVTRSEWLHIAAPLVAVIGCLMASIAYGLAARKAWSRHLVMAIFVLIIVYASTLGALNVLRYTIMWRAIVNASLFGCASAWYFYFKPNVAQYFRKLGAR